MKQQAPRCITHSPPSSAAPQLTLYSFISAGSTVKGAQVSATMAMATVVHTRFCRSCTLRLFSRVTSTSWGPIAFAMYPKVLTVARRIAFLCACRAGQGVRLCGCVRVVRLLDVVLLRGSACFSDSGRAQQYLPAKPPPSNIPAPARHYQPPTLSMSSSSKQMRIHSRAGTNSAPRSAMRPTRSMQFS